MLETIKQRHSGRQYNAEKMVSQEKISKLIEAARWAPSCYGEEPWRFLICDKKLSPAAYENVLNTLVEFNQGWAKNAPVLVVIFCKENFAKNGKHNRWAQYDTGAAAMNMCNEAEELGLMAHQMGGFDEKTLQERFKIPSGYEVMSVMALGYEVDSPSDKTERVRKPEDDLFFHGEIKESALKG